MREYPYKSPHGFESSYYGVGLDDNYVCGYSITHENPRQHIWTYSGGIYPNGLHVFDCPCNTGYFYNLQLSYVGNDYYCESGLPLHQSLLPVILYPNDPLWDGQQCPGRESGCCANPNLPWFYRPLKNVSISDIEVRSCVTFEVGNEDIPFDILELYVK